MLYTFLFLSTYCLDIYIYIVIRVPYVYIYILGKDSNLFPTLVILYSLVLKAAKRFITRRFSLYFATTNYSFGRHCHYTFIVEVNCLRKYYLYVLNERSIEVETGITPFFVKKKERVVLKGHFEEIFAHGYYF